MGRDKGIIALALLIVLIQISGCIDEKTENWGREGELELGISLSAPIIAINDTVECTLNLTNVGETNVRFPYRAFHIKIFNKETGDEIDYLVDEDYRDPIMEESDLKVLSPGESYLKTYEINKDYWAIEKGVMHKVEGSFGSYETNMVDMEYWIGELNAGGVTFLVHPLMD